MGDDARKLYGVQFHPEVVHTEAGTAILENFLHTIAGIAPSWRMDSWVDDAIEKVRAQVGDANVLCALSGGVDSAVAATLVARAIGKQLTCIYVDTGLMRKDESLGVVAAFRDVLHLNVIHVDAAGALPRAGSPASTIPKRSASAIGHEFIAIFEEEAKKIPDVRFLVQGTLYPDVIESKTPGSKAGHKIKSHHNVGGLARAHGARAGRAAARAVQGRSARSRPRAGLAERDRRAPAVPRPGPRGAHHRRRHARAARQSCAKPMRS